MYPIDTQDGLFHDGDGISELGTILPASWLNQVQQELIAVLNEAGIIPEKANTKQVVNAIKLIISNSTAKFATQATRLQTARNINGVPFDGTQDINATPAGAVQFFAMSTAPVGWVKANGAAVSRALYANLF
ncbi:tail fiber protein, partial [Snodgrassella communis]|uniref:tail fiber protein n=1 Tax=Snodgrassella communis TaxID=2946699 RepID=UPI0021473F33